MKTRNTKEKKEKEYEPAYLNARDDNLVEGFYCYYCDMPWYNCVCSHDDLEDH